MYRGELTEHFLTDEEKNIFSDHLDLLGLEENVWDMFECMFESKTRHTYPLVLRLYKDEKLEGTCIIILCRKSGRSLFRNRLLAGVINIFRFQTHLWIRFGCCVDMMSNPGFVRDPGHHDEVIAEMMKFLAKNTFLTIVTEYPENQHLYPKATVHPGLPNALIDTSGMSGLEDYTSRYKNLRRKLKKFASKGGKYSLVESQLNAAQLEALKACFISTSEKSELYLPYQDLYLSSALHTGSTSLRNVYYFIAEMNDTFIGYQAAIKTGKYLYGLHGAFNRNLHSNYHAYDILFVRMTEFALANGLEKIDYGVVINSTKQKMVNKTLELSYFVMSKHRMIRWIFSQMLRATRIQSRDQLRFRNPA
jgi:hypothetical protein